MANFQERPGLDLAAGARALAETLPRVLTGLGASGIDQLGWSSSGANTLFVPMVGILGENLEQYLLRLHFRTGRGWPPSAQFVNPQTRNYVLGEDQHHLPQLTAGYCNVHPSYRSSDGRHLQLVCCSATYEYYDVLHGGDERFLWRETDTFLVTLNAIGRAFQENYSGRTPHAG